MSESQHKAFFDAHGERLMDTWFGGASESFFVEDLYQAFKERMIAELAVSSPELLDLGALVEREPESNNAGAD